MIIVKYDRRCIYRRRELRLHDTLSQSMRLELLVLLFTFTFELALDRAWLSSVTVCNVLVFSIEVFLSDESGKNDVIDAFLQTFSLLVNLTSDYRK